MGTRPSRSPHKAFDLLIYLVEHQGRLVEKATLMAARWPDTIVEEANLAFQVSALRQVLDEGGTGESLIQTVPTRGYRFVGQAVTSLPSTPISRVAIGNLPSVNESPQQSLHAVSRFARYG